GEPFAYRTVALPGFPNVFTLIGPHSPFGNQSLFTISETQMDYALRFIDLWRRGEVDAASPSRAATDAYNAELRAAIPNTIWASGCKSWYIGQDGLPTPGPGPQSVTERCWPSRSSRSGSWLRGRRPQATAPQAGTAAETR